MKNNTMVSLQTVRREQFDGRSVWVPLFQRNYKWRPSTALRFASDLWDAWDKGQERYTIGMITIHMEEKDGRALLVDGQQRIITLILLLKILERGEEHFRICFERDKGLAEDMVSRRDYLANPEMELPPEKLYTDLERFQENYREIKGFLEGKEAGLEGEEEFRQKRQEFARYVYEHVYVLLYMASQEPLDEFMNINCNKTRFGITDYVRAYQFMSAGEMKVERGTITQLFRELAKKLYSDRTKLWELVSRGYGGGEWPADQNRLEILFLDRCLEQDTGEMGSAKLDNLNDMQQEFRQLSWHNRILNTMLEDWSLENWNSARAFLCLRELKEEVKPRFFSLSILNPGEAGRLCGEEPLERKLLEQFRRLGCFGQNCFIQTQMMGGRPDLNSNVPILPVILEKRDKKSLNREWDEEGQGKGGREHSWIWKGQGDWKDFVRIYEEYIQEKYSEMTYTEEGDSDG